MENPTSKYTLTFYNVQPLTFSLTFMKTLNRTTMQKDTIDAYSADAPRWLKSFQNLGNAYQSLTPLSIRKPSMETLREDFRKPEFMVRKNHSLETFLDEGETDVSLLFDRHTQYFLLCYKIRLEISEPELRTLIETPETADKSDLYNTVRNLMVREHETDAIGKYAKAVETETLKVVHQFLKESYRLKHIDDDAVFVQTNTGNLTVMLSTPKGGLEAFEKPILTLNDHAERRDYHGDPVRLKDGTVYYFNGRFHTILLGEASDEDRFMPIQFHMQYMWMYALKMYALMEYVNREILIKHSTKTLKDLNQIIDNIIQKVQHLSLFHSNFKRAIESDNKNIYAEIETLWHIDETLQGTEEYMNNFKDYLSRKHLTHSSRANRRQSNILFVLSMIQLFSLIGVWSSYLSLLDQTDFEAPGFFLRVFGSQENLMRFNMALPLIFLFFILVLFVNGYVRNANKL